MRIYPHLQDTGGFFVAVLEKKPRQNNHASVAAYVPVPSSPQIFLPLFRKRDAEEADIAVPEAKKAKLDLSGPPEPQESDSYPPTPMSEDDGSRPLVLDTIEPDAQASKAKTVAWKGKPKISDPSFKEMPYTFLELDDPTLISCMFVFPHHHYLRTLIYIVAEINFILRPASHRRTSLSA